MLRTTIYLQEHTALALRHLAEADGISQAEIMRTAIEKYVEQLEQQRTRTLPPGAGAYRSGRNDVSQKAEELLRKRARSRK
ncbi:MAG: CopG family transcriptional regulator [Candidatus Obscuribacterales bacterium]